MERNDRYIHFSGLRVGDGNGDDKIVNLFTHPFYYLQNEINDVETRNKVKALLFLHTLEMSYPTVDKSDNRQIESFFNHRYVAKTSPVAESNISGIETAPYGYLLLLGGLYWRKQLEKDPIKYKEEGVVNFIGPSDKNDPLFAPITDISNGTKRPVFIVSETRQYYGQDFAKFSNLCAIPETVHTTAIPKLIKLFEDFAEGTFKEIMDCCEIKVVDTEDNKKYLLSAKQFVYIKNKLSGSSYINSLDNTLNLLNGNEVTEISENGFKKYKFVNFKDNYVMAFVKNEQLYSYFSEDSRFQAIFRNLEFKEVLVMTISNQENSVNMAYDEACYKAFFEGYGEVIENSIRTDERNLSDVSDSEDGYDFKCSMYMTFKNIWDRWLCGYYNMDTVRIGNRGEKINGKEFFLVKNFFNKNFVFIDSFYNDIHDTLKLNALNLLELYTSQGNDGEKLGTTAVAHLGSVASKHMCHMFNFPDSVNFAEIGDDGNPKEIDMLENMKQVFTPTNKVGEPTFSNKFTIILTHPANKLETNDRNNFVPDTFDIWSYNDGTEVAPAVFKSSDIDSLTSGAAMGYKVPAFGVAYSRQNNSIWKSVNVGMDNFAVTEQSIKSLDYIVSKGNSEAHNITPYGQDVYRLYQSYSYTVTVEMMGDMQIQPLMYFQLMNIPMFRGTYMIIKVEHNITVGNATTRFTGVKMSKVQMPYTKYWFKTSDDDRYSDKDIDESDDGKDKISTSDGDIDLADNKLSSAINEFANSDMYCDEFVIEVYKKLGVGINKLL